MGAYDAPGRLRLHGAPPGRGPCGRPRRGLPRGRPTGPPRPRHQPGILAEVRDVLTRPRTLRKFPALTPGALDAFLRDVEVLAVLVDPVPRTFALERDPKDEPSVNLALAVGASYLVSRDRDLLDLMADAGFRRRFPHLVILDPPALLAVLRAPAESRSRDQEGPGRAEGS